MHQDFRTEMLPWLTHPLSLRGPKARSDLVGIASALRSSQRRWWLNRVMARVLCTLAVVATLSACHSDRKVEAPVPVRVAIVGAGDGEAGSRFTGALRPNIQVDLAFKSGGYVAEILQVKSVDGSLRNLQEGDSVRKDTVLAKVRESEYRDQSTEAQAALTKAKADFQRTAQLYENGSASKADYDAAFAAMNSTKARFQQTETALHDTQIVAPMDGVILKRGIEVGQLASPSTAAFTLADIRSVKVDFGVPDGLIGKMKMGTKQAVTVSALAPHGDLEGQISRVAASADPTSRDFNVEVILANPEGSLKPGMIASLKVETAGVSAAPVLAIPIEAVVRPPGESEGFGVYEVDHQGDHAYARIRRITPGDIVGNDVAVMNGVKAGDEIIISGNTLVQEGQEVRVVR